MLCAGARGDMILAWPVREKRLVAKTSVGYSVSRYGCSGYDQLVRRRLARTTGEHSCRQSITNDVVAVAKRASVSCRTHARLVVEGNMRKAIAEAFLQRNVIISNCVAWEEYQHVGPALWAYACDGVQRAFSQALYKKTNQTSGALCYHGVRVVCYGAYLAAEKMVRLS